MGKNIDKCITKCSGNNRFYKIQEEEGFIPKDIIQKLKNSGVIVSLYRCGYCETIWADILDKNFKTIEEKLIFVKNMSSDTEKKQWYV